MNFDKVWLTLVKIVLFIVHLQENKCLKFRCPNRCPRLKQDHIYNWQPIFKRLYPSSGYPDQTGIKFKLKALKSYDLRAFLFLTFLYIRRETGPVTPNDLQKQQCRTSKTSGKWQTTNLKYLLKSMVYNQCLSPGEWKSADLVNKNTRTSETTDEYHSHTFATPEQPANCFNR